MAATTPSLSGGSCIIYLTIFQFFLISADLMFGFYLFIYLFFAGTDVHCMPAAEIRSTMAFPLGGGGVNRPARGAD